MTFVFLSSDDISTELALRVKNRRLAQKLTQEGLANRSGVPFGTLKKFERSGQISLISFIKLVTALGDEGALEKLLLKPKFDSIDEVLKRKKEPLRGTIK
ncbi:MAG: helix-turn-helix domain-containing protein [Hyphomicrobiales bacterium]